MALYYDQDAFQVNIWQTFIHTGDTADSFRSPHFTEECYLKTHSLCARPFTTIIYGISKPHSQ